MKKRTPAARRRYNLAALVTERHHETVRKVDELAAEVRAHVQADAKSFEGVEQALKEIGGDVKSLLDTRTFQRGAWKATVTIAGAAGTAGGIVFALAKHLWAG